VTAMPCRKGRGLLLLGGTRQVRGILRRWATARPGLVFSWRLYEAKRAPQDRCRFRTHHSAMAQSIIAGERQARWLEIRDVWRGGLRRLMMADGSVCRANTTTIGLSGRGWPAAFRPGPAEDAHCCDRRRDDGRRFCGGQSLEIHFERPPRGGNGQPPLSAHYVARSKHY